MFAKAAHGDEDFASAFPIQALAGGHPKAYLLPRDSILLDERWFQRALLGYITLQRDGVKEPA